MAFRGRGGHSRPKYSISTSVKIRDGKYAKGPSFGLWDADSGPMARGSVKDEYLEDLVEFLEKAAKKEVPVAFALFKNKDKGRDDDDGEYRSRRSREDDDRDEKPRRRRDREDEDEDKEEKRSSRRSRKEEDEDEGKEERSSKRSKKGSKKDSWDFDD